MRLTLLAFAALFVTGCARHLANPIDGDPFNTPTGPQTVYIWNGKTCVEATRTPLQLRKTEILKTAGLQNGEMKTLQVYAEDVPPPVMRKLYMDGGTIVLPNGEKMVFPAGSSRGTVVVQNGKSPTGAGQTLHVDAPDSTVLQQNAIVQKNGVAQDFDLPDPATPTDKPLTVTTMNVADLQTTSPDKSEWWNSPAAMDAAAKDAVKLPASSSTQGRVGYGGVSYGMGQIKKP